MKKLFAVTLPTLPQGEHPDHIFPGLIFRVGGKRRTWTLRHRVGSKRRRDILGHFPAMGLLDARNAAKALSERVEAGAPIEPPPAHPRQGGATVGDIINRYEKMRRTEGGRVKTLDAAMRTVRAGLADYLKLPAKQFSKADLRAARGVISERAPMQANRFVAYFGPVWKWASQEDLVPHNFTGDLRKAPERKRDRVLTKPEMWAIWKGCDQHRRWPLGAKLRKARALPAGHRATAKRRRIASLRRHHRHQSLEAGSQQG